MGSLKFRIKGVEFQYDGEPEELMAFINRFLSENEESHEYVAPKFPRKEKAKMENIEPIKIANLPLPNDADIVKYITSKPNFTHDLLEIQRKFYGKIFSSRGKEQRMYHKTARQLRAIREIIERQYKGEFIDEPAGQRNLKRFSFKATQPTLLESQKTS